MADKIRLRNMVFYGYHGAFAAEKEIGQRFEVDVEITTDLVSPARADDVELAINYVDLYTIVKDVVEEKEFNLIESMAGEIAQQILSSHDVDEVLVRVRKPAVPIGGLIDCVEAEIVRRRGSGGGD